MGENSKKIVLKVYVHDEKSKQKALRAVSGLMGIESLAMDMKEKKLTVIGEVDPVDVAAKLRKKYRAEILTVGPAKEPEKKKEEPKKEEPKKEEPKKEDDKKEEVKICHWQYDPCAYRYPHYYPVVCVDENPNNCNIL